MSTRSEPSRPLGAALRGFAKPQPGLSPLATALLHVRQQPGDVDPTEVLDELLTRRWIAYDADNQLTITTAGLAALRSARRDTDTSTT